MTTTNRLAQETSPYLRQHADNPVDWYPWGDEAFAAARQRDVPVLLSVGYSACHWCHVMAHESFEDEATAAVMNEQFVSVKVDREERPDVDSIYMEAVQLVSGSGGWPMTLFLLPDGRPFFGGTYFPRAGFVDLMQRVSTVWRGGRQGLEGDAVTLADAVRNGLALPTGEGLQAGLSESRGEAEGRGASVVRATAEALVSRFDAEWGGFGGAPKFPQPGMLELLLAADATGSAPSSARQALITTLDAMASGGIYDHLAGGFARYATDRRWLVPHFEKMLYDNALLARVYVRAWQVTGFDRYRQVVEETVGYLLAPPVRQPGGGMSSAEDADSEGVEGRFYVWDEAEVHEVAGVETAAWYGVTSRGNWEGHNILWRPARGELARPAEVEAGRQALLRRRADRTRPGLDDKVLTEWNAMAVAALAEAGAVLGRPDWITAAAETAEFLLAALRRPDGRWLRSWQHRDDPAAVGAGGATGPGAERPAGRAQHLAYAADYAWLTEAFVRLAEATGQARWIAEARRGADDLLTLFADPAGAGFFSTGSDAEALIARPKDTYDGATPSAVSVAAVALLRLAGLTGEGRYRAAATDVLAAMGPALDRAPLAFTVLAAAAGLADGLTEVAVTGVRPDLLAEVRRAYRPDVVLAWGEPYPSPLWEGRSGPDTAGLAFVCQDFACRAPAGDPAGLRAAFEGR